LFIIIFNELILIIFLILFRKVAELTTQFFISNEKINVTGLILAGLADFKSELFNSDLLDPRLKEKVLKIVDVSYGGDNGFNQAIELSAEVLQNVKFIQEKKLISKFFEEIAQDTGNLFSISFLTIF
jgi:peptide chain release factor subunit 1